MKTVAMIISIEKDLIIYHGSNKMVYNNEIEFIEDIPTVFKNVIGVVLNIFRYEPTEFESNLDFCEAIKEKMDSHQIQHFFSGTNNSVNFAILLAANINMKLGETVLLVTIDTDRISITELEYTEHGYKQLQRKILTVDVKENPKHVSEKILGSLNPKKVLLMGASEDKLMMKFLRKALKSNKLIAFDQPPALVDDKIIEEMKKWFLDKTYTKHFIIPVSDRIFVLGMVIDGKKFFNITVEANEALPYTESTLIRKSCDTLFFGCLEDTRSLRTIKMESRCHRKRITLEIDAENFVKVKEEIITIPKIVALPEKLDEKDGSKIPVIGIMNDFSVICVYKNDGYQFLDSWNGLYGKELFINFDEEKPNICGETFPLLPAKQSFIVYDLINILSMPPDDIDVCETWQFTITKDSENPVLLEFDTFDGSKKLATPAFLMAMVIRQHMKFIRAELGEKPAEIRFCLFDDLNAEERKRVEEGIQEACKLLKIDCTFVDV